MPERVSGPPPSMLPGAALSSFAARFCWQGQHFRLWTVPERVSGPPPLDAARRSTFEPRGSLAARFCWQGQHFRLWTVPERVSGPPPLDAARRSTFEPRGSLTDTSRLTHTHTHTYGSFLLAGAALQALDGARARFGAPPPRCCQAQHFRASRLVSAGRGSTSGSGRCPSAFRGMLPGAALSSLAGASRLVSAGRGSTSGSGRCPSAFRGPPPRCCQAQHFRASRLVSAGRGSTSGSGRCPSAFRGPPPSMLPDAALSSFAARFC